LELVALIAGVVAIGMSAPTFAQMFWGRPRIEIDFDDTMVSGAIFLQCHAYNDFINSRLLRLLGVRRETAVDTWAVLRIRESGSGRIVLPYEAVEFTGRNGEPNSTHVPITSGTIGRKFGVVWLNPNSKIVKVVGREDMTLGVGEYLADINVFAAERKKAATHKFVIHADGSLYWDPN